MKLLLDTHVYVWWANADPQLSASARDALATGELFISPVVFWEIATKQKGGRWPEGARPLDDAARMIADGTLRHLPITHAHARRAGDLLSAHKDPFDRMLAAQAALDGLTLVTADAAFRTLDCPTLW